MNEFNTLYYAVKHNDMDIVMHSRSGGAFTAISDYVIDMDGVVYGCCLDKDFRVIHSRAETKDVRDLFRGSKYVQSNLKNTFVEVKNDLLDKKWVLYSGTSCQIDGLYSYLRKKKIQTEKLITIDIVCHGVPSPRVWKDNLAYMEEIAGNKIKEVDFRNKLDNGWKEHIEKYVTDGGCYEETIFTQLFYSNNITCKSCYYCPYKSLKRVSDITLADCWGIEKSENIFNDDKGTSLVMVNSEKGYAVWEAIKKNIRFIEIQIKDYMQVPFEKPYPMPAVRKMFWKDYRVMPFKKIVDKYVRSNIIWRNYFRLYERIKKYRKVLQDDICCGCTACYAVCPVNCIKMVQNEEGFYTPKIDKKRCINCNQCKQVCRFKKLVEVK